MSQAEASIIIALVGLVLSVVASAFIAGSRWGSVNQRLEELQRADASHVSQADMANVREQLAEIRGMFRLTLKEDKAA